MCNHREYEPNKFLENVNNFKSNLKFTHEISKDNINQFPRFKCNYTR